MKISFSTFPLWILFAFASRKAETVLAAPAARDNFCPHTDEIGTSSVWWDTLVVARNYFE